MSQYEDPWDDLVLSRLLIVDPPKPYENIQSFVLRHSELNCYPRPSWLYDYMCSGLSNIRFCNLCFAGKLLPELTGFPPEQFKEMGLRGDGLERWSKVSVGERFEASISLFNVLTARTCPHCIEEFGAALSIWDFRPYVACTRHRCFLTERCNNPTCGHQINWLRPSLSTCVKCETPFRSIPSEEVPSEELIEYLKMLERRWGAVPFSCPEPEINELERLDDTAFFKLIYSLRHRLRTAKFPNANTSYEGEIQIGLVIASSFVDWPNNFGNYVRAIVQPDCPDEAEFSILRSLKFKRLLQAAMEMSSETHWKVVADAIANWVVSSEYGYQVTAKGGSRLSKKIADINSGSGNSKTRYLTRTETMERLSISAPTFRKLFKNGYLSGKLLKMRGQHVYRVTLESIEHFETHFLS